jgi:hypothetical protein
MHLMRMILTFWYNGQMMVDTVCTFINGNGIYVYIYMYKYAFRYVYMYVFIYKLS